MQMERSQFEETFAFRQFEVGNLDHNAQRLAERNHCNDQQQGPLTSHEGDDSQRRAQGLGASVSHEQFRWMNVEPQKAKNRANHCETKTCQIILALDKSDPTKR